MNERNEPIGRDHVPDLSRCVEPDPVSAIAVAGSGANPTALIADAEALHAVLGDTRARAGRLTGALRRYPERERLMASTLAALEQLELPEVTA